MIRRAGRVPCMALALALAAGPGSAHARPGPGPEDPEYQELLVELRFGRLAAVTVRAFSDGALALLPARQLLELAELEVMDDPAGGFRATLHPERRVIRVLPERGEVRVDGVAVPVREGWVHTDPAGQLFLATPLLEALLGVRIQTDWVDLLVVVMNPEVLPLGRRLAREARWNAGVAGSTARRRGLAVQQLAAPPLGGAVLDWGLSANGRDPDGSLAYSAGVAARVMGGSLRVSSRSVGPLAQGDHTVDGTYETVFQDAAWIRQMRLGDGFTTGPRLRNVRGFSLTNAPFLRGSEFGTDVFAGRVGPGWEVELRQAGRTLDLLRADEQGAFALDIPLRYGENAVQVLAFGPHGEVVTTERLLLLGQDRLPGGTFEWGLSGGECRGSSCRETGNLDLRFGLSNQWTVRAGAEAFTRDSLSTLMQPYVGVTGMVVPSLELALEGVGNGFLRAGATFAPTPRVRLRGVHTRFDTGVEAPVLHDARRRSTTEADVFLRPAADNPRLFLRASALRQDLDAATLARYQAALTVPFGNLALESGVRRESASGPAEPAAGGDFQFAALNGVVRVGRRHSVYLRGEAELREAEAFERARAQAAIQLGAGTRLELGVAWQRFAGTALTLSLSSLLPQARTVSQAVVRAGAPATITQFSQGTVHWNEAIRRVSFAPGPGVERGGVAGYVFLDRDGDGAMGPGEEPLEGVRVVVGNETVTSDARGRISHWDLVPFEPVELWTDSASIQDPTLVPTFNRVRVTVPPASFGWVNLPVTPAREIWGRVVRVEGGAEVPVPYARLELLDRETGTVRTVQTFSDGEFYEAGVTPGRYVLRLDPAFRERSGLIQESGWVPVVVSAGESAASPDPVELRLVRPARPLPQTSNAPAAEATERQRTAPDPRPQAPETAGRNP
ncbi:MAG: carboxypeptidase-like regulatory domain-containing protein [Longimicrobiales bacterium]|nr:carboxypeptidase-like regulatory domain-containing protein [Longimicrobiales bacterium]